MCNPKQMASFGIVVFMICFHMGHFIKTTWHMAIRVHESPCLAFSLFLSYACSIGMVFGKGM